MRKHVLILLGDTTRKTLDSISFRMGVSIQQPELVHSAVERCVNIRGRNRAALPPSANRIIHTMFSNLKSEKCAFWQITFNAFLLSRDIGKVPIITLVKRKFLIGASCTSHRVWPHVHLVNLILMVV